SGIRKAPCTARIAALRWNERSAAPASSGFGLRPAVNQYRYCAADHDLVRDAAEQHTLNAGASVGGHANQVAAETPGRVHDPVGGRVRAVHLGADLHARLFGEAA